MSAFDSLTTRSPNGLTNAAPWQTMGASGTPDPTWSVLFSNDFLTPSNVSDMHLTQVGTSAGTFAAEAGADGLALLTTSAGATDSTIVGLATEAFEAVPGKQLFFKLKAAVATASATFECGFGTFTAGEIQEGITLKSVAGVLTLQVYRAGAVTFSAPLPEVLSTSVQTELGFMVDWQGNVAAFFNPTTGGPASQASQVTANNVANGGQARGHVAALYRQLNGVATGLALPTVGMDPFFQLTNTVAAASTASVDFIVASRER